MKANTCKLFLLPIGESSAHHLYVCEDSALQSGDLCFWDGRQKTVLRIKDFETGPFEECWNSDKEYYDSLHQSNLYKIIASTDRNLKVAKVPKAIIEKYFYSGGRDTSIEIQYENGKPVLTAKNYLIAASNGK